MKEQSDRLLEILKLLKAGQEPAQLLKEAKEIESKMLRELGLEARDLNILKSFWRYEKMQEGV